MSVVSEIITQDQIQDLWGCGFTIVSRHRHPAPFFVPQDMVPQGRSYQWWHLVHDKSYFRPHEGNPLVGWAPVPASRHDGYFMPFGHVGDIEVQGLGLFEKPKFEVEQERAQNADAAHQLVVDWAKNAADAGLSGEFKVGGAAGEVAAALGPDFFSRPKNKTIETTTQIPKDMVPHMDAIFTERDRLEGKIVLPNLSLKSGEIADKFYAAIDADKSLPWWPTLRAILLPIAIKNVRKSLKQESGS